MSNLAAVGRDTALYNQALEELSETKATITTLSTAAAKAAAEIEALHARASSPDTSPRAV